MKNVVSGGSVFHASNDWKKEPSVGHDRGSPPAPNSASLPRRWHCSPTEWICAAHSCVRGMNDLHERLENIDDFTCDYEVTLTLMVATR